MVATRSLLRQVDEIRKDLANLGSSGPAELRRAVLAWRDTGEVPAAPTKVRSHVDRVARFSRFVRDHLFEVTAEPILTSWSGDPASLERAMARVGQWKPWDGPVPVPSAWLPPPEAIHADRWEIDPRQWLWIFSEDQVAVAPCGRRSLKSEGLLFRTIFHAVTHCEFDDARFFLGAPTADQAKSVLWDRVKKMVPSWALLTGDDQSINETRMEIRLWNEAKLRCVSGDKPSRIEGRWFDGGGFTEYGDCKPGIFTTKVQPMLGRGGWFAAEGVPEGRNHYWDLTQKILEGTIPRSGHYHWWTEEVLHLYQGPDHSAGVISTAQATLSEIEYQQEYRASWESFQSRAYYAFDRGKHTGPLRYDPSLPLFFAFDFGVNPGVIVVLQEQPAPAWLRERVAKSDGAMRLPTGTVTCAIDEIRINRGSNTPTLLGMLLAKYSQHASGEVGLFGDPAGGKRGTTSDAGSDWDVILAELGKAYGRQLAKYVRKADPGQRARLNSTNARLATMDGTVSMVIDPNACPWLVRDFEGAELDDEGGMVKRSGDPVGHEADAVTYYCERMFPTKQVGEIETRAR